MKKITFVIFSLFLSLMALAQVMDTTNEVLDTQIFKVQQDLEEKLMQRLRPIVQDTQLAAQVDLTFDREKFKKLMAQTSVSSKEVLDLVPGLSDSSFDLVDTGTKKPFDRTLTLAFIEKAVVTLRHGPQLQESELKLLQDEVKHFFTHLKHIKLDSKLVPSPVVASKTKDEKSKDTSLMMELLKKLELKEKSNLKEEEYSIFKDWQALLSIAFGVLTFTFLYFHFINNAKSWVKDISQKIENIQPESMGVTPAFNEHTAAESKAHSSSGPGINKDEKSIIDFFNHNEAYTLEMIKTNASDGDWPKVLSLLNCLDLATSKKCVDQLNDSERATLFGLMNSQKDSMSDMLSSGLQEAYQHAKFSNWNPTYNLLRKWESSLLKWSIQEIETFLRTLSLGELSFAMSSMKPEKVAFIASLNEDILKKTLNAKDKKHEVKDAQTFSQKLGLRVKPEFIAQTYNDFSYYLPWELEYEVSDDLNTLPLEDIFKSAGEFINQLTLQEGKEFLLTFPKENWEAIVFDMPELKQSRLMNMNQEQFTELGLKLKASWRKTLVVSKNQKHEAA